MHIAFDIPADLDTPVSAFLKLSHLRPRFLLESVEEGRLPGRYAFIGFGDAPDVRLEGDVLRSGGRVAAPAGSREEILDSLRAALAATPGPAPAGCEIPFRGGLAGVTGYGLARRLDGPGGVAPGSGEPDAIYVAPRSLVVLDQLTRRAALLHDGDVRERASLRREILRALCGPPPVRGASCGHEPPRPSLERGAFMACVEKARGLIAEGEIYQIVLSVRFTGRCDTPPFEAYRALRLLNPSPYMYFFDLGDVAVAGCSPETLVRLRGREASLRPIAGTRPRGIGAAADAALERELLADPKEAAEHAMLVDLARNDLGRVAVPGSVTVGPFRAVERYSHVMHISSGVRGLLAPDADAFDLFASAFPAGTVVGAPKIRAMELIDGIEAAPRGLYAGSVGWFDRGGDMDQAIAIRTITFREGRYAYQAGAGIVAESSPEREHAEVVAKAAALGAAMDLAGGGL